MLGIQQVAIGGLDKQALSAFWVDTLGVKKVGDYRAEKENVDEDILELGSGPHAVEIDLMQPLNPEVAPKVSVELLPGSKWSRKKNWLSERNNMLSIPHLGF